MKPPRIPCSSAKSPIAILLLLLLLTGTLRAESPGLSDLEGLTARWIALRGTLAEESRLWRQRKAAWEEEIVLLEEEAAALEAELAATRDIVSSTEARQANAIEQHDRIETELNAVGGMLGKLSNVYPPFLADRIPPPLREQLPVDLRYGLKRLPANTPRTARAQKLIAFLSALETLQNNIHVVQETLETEQGRRHVEVLYIGLARGFAVSPGNDWAAIGVPGEKVWTWTPGGVDPMQVRKMIEIQQQQQTAALVPAPLGVAEETP